MSELGSTGILIGAAAIVVMLIIWLMYEYNRFAAKQRKIDVIWDEVDEHLKLRHDLIPQLLAIAKGKMGSAECVFGRINELNAQVSGDIGDSIDDAQLASIESELSGLLRRLRDDAGRIPDLMLDQNFLTTLAELVSMEGRAAAACERHNDLVREYNRSIRSFPASIFVHFLHFDSCEMRIFG